jgi:hypothetical protein
MKFEMACIESPGPTLSQYGQNVAAHYRDVMWASSPLSAKSKAAATSDLKHIFAFQSPHGG